MMFSTNRAATTLVLLVATASAACRSSGDAETVAVALRNSETYQFAMATGDEDGARIVAQAEHFAVSEIRRDSSTNWSALYVYAPAASFVGEDSVQLEILSGSDGASAPTRRKRVTIRFSIRE